MGARCCCEEARRRPGRGAGDREVARAGDGVGRRVAGRDRAGDDRAENGWPFGHRRRRGPAALRHAPPAGAGSAADGVRMISRNWPKQFRAAASTFDWAALAQLAAEYATHLYAIPKPPDSVGQVLLVLRQSRRYQELELVADAALAHGLDAPAVRRYYAQALVDGGHPAVALRLFTGLAADETASRVDRIEARGGIGRCYKEMFLACTEPDRGRRFLSRSLEAYLAAYLEDTDIYTWHGINAVSLLARAARDGIQLPSGSPSAAALADDILRTVDSDPVPDMFTEVTACEAAVARIQTADEQAFGTGFLVAGPDLHPDLPPLVLVTNGHVVPEDLDPGHAHVAFHGLDEDPGRQARFRVAQQWWYQPSADRGLDTTILELDGYPQDVVPTPLVKGLPPKPLR